MLLAHGGGVPEALTLGVPVLVVLGLVLVERAARRKARAAEVESDGEP